MAHPSSRSNRKPKEQQIDKATNTQKYNVSVDTNLNPATDRMRLGPYSLPSLRTIQGMIEEEAKRELRFPQSTRIYKQMGYDADISSALSLVEAVISKTEWIIETPKDAPQEEKDRAEKLNYNLKIMNRPFTEYVSEILSYLTYGFHTPEKIYSKMETPVGNFTGIKDLRTISQDTIKEWIFERRTGDLSGIKQDLSRIPQSTVWAQTIDGKSEVEIPRKKFLLFRNNTKRNSPEGVSPLRGSYISWKFKSLVEEFETIYTTKGFGGILDLGIDVSYLSKAKLDPSGNEAIVLEEMKKNAANFHNGDQAYVITPLAYNEKGNPLFHTKILETKPPSANDIIKRHSHRMLQTFFADILQLGSTGGGSYALAEMKSPLLMTGILHHLNNIKRTLDHDLIRQLYELNNWTWDARTSCFFVYDEVDEVDLDTLSKSVQRIFATKAIEPTEDVEDWIRDKFFDLPKRSEADTQIRVVEDMQSRAGDGMAAGMPNGTGDSSDGGDDSASNSENA